MPPRMLAVSWCSVPVNVPGVAYRDYRSETAFQVFCADWLRKLYARTGNPAFCNWHHSANERHGARAGWRAKMMGQAKGWPDFVQPGLELALELKVPGGEPTPEQCQWLDYFNAIGWTARVVRSFEAFREVVECAARGAARGRLVG